MPTRCTLNSVVIAGFPGIELTNGLLTLKMVPELGGKIVSISNRTSRWEWLSPNPFLPLRTARYGDSFTALHDSGGLDECFPSVAPVSYPFAPWQDSFIPDHGELWSQPWEVEVITATAEQIELSMHCYGVRLPYRFERCLTMTAGSPVVRLAYQVTNYSAYDMPFVWSIHPILHIETGMHLSLPDGVTTLRIDSTTDSIPGRVDSHCDWPVARIDARPPVDLSRVPTAGLGQAFKVFTPPLRNTGTVSTAISDEAGRRSLAFRFHPSEITHVGVWMNYGGWSGCGSPPYFNLGLEPCIGGADSLLTATELGEYAVLTAKQTKHWSMEMIVQ